MAWGTLLMSPSECALELTWDGLAAAGIVSAEWLIVSDMSCGGGNEIGSITGSVGLVSAGGGGNFALRMNSDKRAMGSSNVIWRFYSFLLKLLFTIDLRRDGGVQLHNLLFLDFKLR